MKPRTTKILLILAMIFGVYVLFKLVGVVSHFGPNPVAPGRGLMADEAVLSNPLADFSQSASLSKDSSGGMMSYSTVSDQSVKSKSLPAPTMKSESAANADADDQASNEEDRKIKKNGQLYLKVDKTEAAAAQITEIAQAHGGEISSSNFNEGARGARNGNLSVKVPADQFESAFNQIKSIATQIINESTTSQDVTEQYVDLQAQLKNKRAEEETIVNILNRAGAIPEVLEVTKEVARVRGEIERLEGKIKYLENQTSFSIITVNLSEDVEIAPVTGNWRPGQVFKNSVKTLIKRSQNFIDGLIAFIIVGIPSLIPYFLIGLFVYWVVKKIRRRIQKTGNSKFTENS